MRATGGGVEHLAINGIISLPGIKAFGGAPGSFPGEAQVEEEERNSEGRECKPKDLSHDWPGQPSGKHGSDHHRCPLRQSSSRAQTVTIMPASARAINNQRKLSR